MWYHYDMVRKFEPEATVAVLTEDSLLRELLGELLAQERMLTVEVSTLEELSRTILGSVEETLPEGVRSAMPQVIVVDALMDPDMAWALLEDPDAVLHGVPAAIVVIGSSVTPERVLHHPHVDRVLAATVGADVMVRAIRYHASVRARRLVSSDVHFREQSTQRLPALDEASSDRLLSPPNLPRLAKDAAGGE